MTNEELDALVTELRNTHPRDSGYAEKANQAADLIEALRAAPAEPVAMVEVGGLDWGPFIFRETPYGADHLETGTTKLYTRPQAPSGWVMVPREPSEEMLIAAREWSNKKYGKPIGNEAAQGCWRAMLAVATPPRSEEG